MRVPTTGFVLVVASQYKVAEVAEGMAIPNLYQVAAVAVGPPPAGAFQLVQEVVVAKPDALPALASIRYICPAPAELQLKKKLPKLFATV